jgi:hypothetical protein
MNETSVCAETEHGACHSTLVAHAQIRREIRMGAHQTRRNFFSDVPE